MISMGQSREFLQRTLFGRSQTLGDFGPVDDVIEGVDVIGTPVLVVEVIGMFPDVDAEKGGSPLREGAVLVGGALDDQLPLVRRQPRPAASKPAHRGLGEL